MIQNRILAKEREWALSCLENIFYYALEEGSKCLIQACVVIAQQDFSGVPAFSQHTQVKFLLESIHHIILDNCQQEYIHIIQYLKLLHSLCPEAGCQEEFINSLLKLKQSYVLYTLLENESAADVCTAMNEFFPKHDPLGSFPINKNVAKKRCLAVVRRQIYSFQKLVTKLLTEVEFRQDYFFDEWVEEFGPSFHAEMISDVEKYLSNIEAQLLGGVKCYEIYRSWTDRENIRNPAMLCFLRLLTEAESDEVSEFDILSLLKWTFPSLDTMLLTMPCEGSVKVPSFLKDVSFDKFLSQTCKLTQEMKPWRWGSFRQAAGYFAEMSKSLSDSSLSPRSFYGSANKIRNKYSPVVHCTPLKDVRLTESGKSRRIPLTCLDSNTVTVASASNMSLRKRKRADPEGVENHAPKRQCVFKPGVLKPSCRLAVSLRKDNLLVQTPSTRDTDSTIKICFDSPYCKNLLESGSNFFSTGRRKKPPPRCIALDQQTPVRNESSLEEMDFSNDEDREDTGSDCLSVADETMINNLTWISTGTPTSRRGRLKKTCRSLQFKSESSDDHVSESEPELSSHWQPTLQDCITTTNQALLPDLTYHLKNSETRACVVRLRRLTYPVIHGRSIGGCHITDEDLHIICLQDPSLTFRNYS